MTTSLLNEAIEDGVVAVDEHSESLALKLYKRAALMHNEVKKEGWKRKSCSLNVRLCCLFALKMPLQ